VRKQSKTDLLLESAQHAQKLLQQFIAVPFSDPKRATELLHEFERAVEEFKRIRSKAPTQKGRLLRLTDAREPQHCAICQQRIFRSKRDYLEIDGSIYHRACHRAEGARRLDRSFR
jgi:hypothetical protein